MKKTDSDTVIKVFMIKINAKSKLQLSILFFISLTVFIVFSKFIFLVKNKIADNPASKGLVWVFVAIVLAMLITISLYLSIISLIFFIRLILPKGKKEIMQTRKEKLSKAKAKNKIKQYQLNSLEIKELLKSYSTDNINADKIFIKKIENIYNKKFDALDIFYFFENKECNSFDYHVESKNINQYEEMICAYLKDKNIENTFINCVFVFNHDCLSEDGKDFYCCFTGLWNAEMPKNKFVKNRSFNYCGIDKSNNNIYFYKPLSCDGGTEADLSYLIIKELKLVKV